MVGFIGRWGVRGGGGRGVGDLVGGGRFVD